MFQIPIKKIWLVKVAWEKLQHFMTLNLWMKEDEHIKSNPSIHHWVTEEQVQDGSDPERSQGFSLWNAPGKPPEGDAQDASYTRPTSVHSLHCGGAAVLLWAPLQWFILTSSLKLNLNSGNSFLPLPFGILFFWPWFRLCDRRWGLESVSWAFHLLVQLLIHHRLEWWPCYSKYGLVLIVQNEPRKAIWPCNLKETDECYKVMCFKC